MAETIRSLCEQVNSRVNGDITYRTDPELYGVPEYWTEVRGRGFGDCDDYMLTKRRQLLDAGVPHSRIWLHTAFDPQGNMHALLRVRLDDDTDVLLDNEQPALSTPSDMVQAGYRFVSHVRSDGVGGWHTTIY